MNRPVWSSIVLAVAALAMTCLAGWSLLSFPSPAPADDGSLGGIAGDWCPLANTDIRMEAETVQAICYRVFAEYRIDFLFVNAGPTQTLMLGFPFALDEPDGFNQGPVAFRAFQDGAPLSVSLGQGQVDGSSQGYYLHQATFPHGSTMITVRYLASPSWTAGERFPELMPPEFKQAGIQGQEGRYDYWLHTGAGWAGTIGTVVVRYTLADDFRGYGLDVKSDYQGVSNNWPSTTRPETYTNPDERTYQWAFNDLEPTKDDDVLLAFTAVTSFGDESQTLPPVLGAVTVPLATSKPPFSGMTAGWEAVDGSPGTALALSGSGAWMKLGIQGDQKIEEVRIVPGRNDSPESFAAYGRPKSIKVTLSDGTSTVITLADEPSVQKFPISGTAEWVRLDVLDTYPGSKSTQTYISDVSFGNQRAPVFDSFDALIAQGSPASTTPGAGPASLGIQAGLETQAGLGLLTVWPLVCFSIAGAALIAALALSVILLRRRAKQGS